MFAPAQARHEAPPTGGAETLFRSVEHGQVPVDRDVVVFQGEVRGLVMVVVGATQGHGREEVEGDFVVRLRVLDGFAVGCCFQMFVVRTCEARSM